MSRTHRRYRDDDLLQPGQRMRVPMFAMDMDPVRRALASRPSSLHVTDHNGGHLGLHKPGPRFLGNECAAIDSAPARELAYDAVDEANANAWKGHNRPIHDEGFEDARRRRAQYRDPEGREEGTEEDFEDAHSMRDERAQAYADYEAEIREAWRGGK
jgi:hypothetical protein